MLWHKIKTYGRLTGIGLVILGTVLFILSNREPVTVRFLAWEWVTLPLYAFILFVAVGGIVLLWIVRKIGSTLRDVRKLRQEKAMANRMVQKIRQDVDKEKEELTPPDTA